MIASCNCPIIGVRLKLCRLIRAKYSSSSTNHIRRCNCYDYLTNRYARGEPITIENSVTDTIKALKILFIAWNSAESNWPQFNCILPMHNVSAITHFYSYVRFVHTMLRTVLTTYIRFVHTKGLVSASCSRKKESMVRVMAWSPCLLFSRQVVGN